MASPFVAGGAVAQGDVSVPAAAGPSNSFPDVIVVLQGRGFETKFERDVFFLRRIRENYAAHWPALLGANITVSDYVGNPAKLQRFVEELGVTTADTNDQTASTNLAVITSDPAFYANTNAYHPEILRTAAQALIKIGANGRQALAAAFTEDHYRNDPVSLEELANVIGTAAVPDAQLAQALAATAFTFTATNGGTYPRCTEVATRNLLRLAEGPALAAIHLNPKEALDQPGRFQAITDGITAARAAGLATNLVTLEKATAAKLAELAGYPGGYRDDLQDLDSRLKRTIAQLQGPAKDEPSSIVPR